jgi:uncharacterized protein
MALKFEWDPKKNAKNLKKHKIDFEEARTVFEDERALIFSDESHADEEDREIIIGYSAKERLLLVCFVERKKDIVRIYSARKATKNERSDYEENSGITS